MNKFAAVLLALLSIFVVAAEAKAEFLTYTYTWNAHNGWLQINSNEIFEIKIIDGVSDGCWTNSDAVKTAVELELKRSGYKLASSDEERVLSRRIYISSTGFGLEKSNVVNICAANYEFYVSGTQKEVFISNGHIAESGFSGELWRQGGIMTGDKSTFDRRLKEQYVDLVQKFLVTIDVMKKEALDAIRSKATDDAKVYWDNYKLD